MNSLLNENDSNVLMNSINHYESLQHQAKLDYALTKSELVFVESFNLKPFTDGNKWCILLGENIQEGIVGFGDSPILAIKAFNIEMYKSLNNCTTSSQTEISDEEIEKEAELSFGGNERNKSVWINACKWYREQLKKKQ